MSDTETPTQTSDKIHEELKKPPREEQAEKVSKDKLQKQARERSKQKQSLLQKVTKAFKEPEDNRFRELVINSEALEKRVALLVDGVLEKYEVDRTGEDRQVGSIYKGKIQNLEPGLKAAFVDIGQPKNAFLHYWDILPAANDNTIEVVRENKAKDSKRDKLTIKDIPQAYPIGTDIVVQITKGTIGTKGPRTTTNVSIPGRYLVLMPYGGQCGISKKIEDRKERDRLKRILRSLSIPEGMGVIVRTAGEGKRWTYFVRDLHILLRTWQEITERMEESKKPTLLYREPDLIERTIRDFLTEEIDRVLIDNPADHERILDIVSTISPRSRRKIVHFKDEIPVFERFNIERQIEQTFQRKVPLPSGGEIVIEETEALTAIDVNTGSHKGTSKDGKDFIVQANLEAASESARQVRLRNIGGLVIVDFIDMKNKNDRKAVYNRMRDEMSRDKARSHVLPISQLGIMQMTRQRHSESHGSGIYANCPYCSGRGIVKSPRSMSVEIQRKLVSVIRHARKRADAQGETLNLRVLLHPTNLERIRQEDRQHLIDMEQAYNVKLSFRADPAYHVENFRVVDALTGQEMR